MKKHFFARKNITTLLFITAMVIISMITIFFATSFNAISAEQNIVSITSKGKTVDGILKSTDKDATIEITAKEKGVYEIPYDANYSITYLNEAGEITPIRIIDAENFDKANPSNFETDDDEVVANAFYVREDERNGSLYLNVEQGERLYLKIECNISEAVDVSIHNANNDQDKQTLVHFEVPAQTSISGTVGTDNSVLADSNTETADQDIIPDSLSGPLDLEGADAYKYINVANTQVTDESPEAIEEADYTAEDSLKAPKFTEEISPDLLDTTRAASGDIQVSGVNMRLKTGTASFDANNNAGNDASADNDIVRSYDQISYLVSFSIQNTSQTVQYKNVRYRVTGTLSNAMTISPVRLNGEIANGVYVNNANGSKYSTGFLESTISNGTGQIYVPIIVNVLAAANGTVIKPTFSIQLIDAVNTQTGLTETINKTYNSSNFAALTPPDTKVSAKASVGVNLVAGGVYSGNAININNGNVKTYDMATETILLPLAGRATGDYRGATLPTGTISYSVKQKNTYRASGGTTDIVTPANTVTAFDLFGVSVARNNRDSTWVSKTSIVKSMLTSPLNVPNGLTSQLYTSEPASGTDLKKVGAYNSGSFNYSATVGNIYATAYTPITNSGYAPVINPYTYTMLGNRTNSKTFTTGELVFGIDIGAATSAAQARNWSRFDLTMYVDSISYDGITTNNAGAASITYPNIITAAGAYAGGPIFTKKDASGNHYNLDLNYTYTGMNAGNARLMQGDSIYATNFNLTSDRKVQTIKTIEMWDSTAFQYDATRSIESVGSVSYQTNPSYLQSETYRYGVPKVALTTTPPYNYKVTTYAACSSYYNWYSTPAAAVAAGGKIAAVEVTSTLIGAGAWPGTGDWACYPRIPLNVIGTPGAKTPAGNSITLMEAVQFIGASGNVIYEPQNNVYKPTTYNAAGTGTLNNAYWNFTGETAYIEAFGITTKTDVEKSLYQSQDEIKVKVTGITKGTTSVQYTTKLTTTLPKGISYKAGSTTNGAGAKVTEPTVTKNADGTTTLVWQSVNINVATGVEFNFVATSDVSQLTFQSTGYTENILVTTVGEMWQTGNTANNDKAPAQTRSSQDIFIINIIQQLTIDKTVDKNLIEVGDAGNSSTRPSTAITYTIKTVNESAAGMSNIRVLDVLPYNGDTRGSKYSGSISVTGLTVSDKTFSKLYYKNTSIPDTTNPYDINVADGTWSSMTPSTLNVASLANAKAIMLEYSSMTVGQVSNLSITIKPTGQKPTDVYINNSSLNTSFNLPVTSQPVRTTVYGRQVSGITWYDDSLDGLIGDKPDGTPELFAENIPVELYEQVTSGSTVNNVRITTSLSGEAFVDASGNSLIKTDANGKYTFNNVGSGNYYVKFVVQNELANGILAITKQNIGSNVAINSKANPTTGITNTFTLPVLSELPAKTDSTNLYIQPYLNAGFIRLSSVELFKYKAGTTPDLNDDGIFTDDEKALSEPLAGAEFSLYDSSDNLIATQTTGADGKVKFNGLYPGKYYLVETKAPVGYELIGNKIPFEITELNQVIYLYESDDVASELPFAGTKQISFLLLAEIALLLAAACGFIIWIKQARKQEGNS